MRLYGMRTGRNDLAGCIARSFLSYSYVMERNNNNSIYSIPDNIYNKPYTFSYVKKAEDDYINNPNPSTLAWFEDCKRSYNKQPWCNYEKEKASGQCNNNKNDNKVENNATIVACILIGVFAIIIGLMIACAS